MNWVDHKVDDGVAVLTYHFERGGPCGPELLAQLRQQIELAFGDPATEAIVIDHVGSSLSDCRTRALVIERTLRLAMSEVVAVLDHSIKPTALAARGSVDGCWLELAAACTVRVTAEDVILGSTEAGLGMIPRARGTQTVPRLVGAEWALKMLAEGALVTAEIAKKIGLVDQISPDPVASAISILAPLRNASCPHTFERKVNSVEPGFFDGYLARNARRFRGNDAPASVVDMVRAAITLPYEDAVRLEAATAIRLESEQNHKSLFYAARAEMEAGHVPGLDPAVSSPISNVAVIGSGTMGSGITLAFLAAGFPVVLYERDPAALARGMTQIRSGLQKNVEARRMTEAQSEQALAGLTPVTDMSALDAADLIVEAAYEEMSVKRDIFSQLDRIARPGALLASNTSYLDLDLIAAATSRPADVIGLHFFSPANVMKLLEVVKGARTSDQALATGLDLARRLGKIGVVSGNAFGFIGNRMLAVRRREAEAMTVEGALPQQIDAVLERFGIAMGPFRVSDLSGLDLGWSAQTSTGATLKERMCEAGRRGQKVGAGYYDYDQDGRPQASSATLAIIAQFARDSGVEQREFTDGEILDRLLWPMVDEGAQLLSERVAIRESDIDAVWLNGYGWPRWTGGPMYHARQVGVQEVIRCLEGMGREVSNGLRQLALITN